MQNIVPEEARSEESIYDARFLDRWVDRCKEIYAKYGQQVANSFAQKMFSQDLLREINKRAEERKKKA